MFSIRRYGRSRYRFLSIVLPGRQAVLFVVGALLVHGIAAWFNSGFLNADEHYQIIEFAQYKLGYQSITGLAWEFSSRIRPALQPWLATAIIGLDHRLGVTSPFTIALSLRLLSAALALYVSLELCVRSLGSVTTAWARRAALYASFFLWITPTVHARFSSENWSGALLVGGLCLLLDAADGWPSRRGRAVGLAACAGLVWSAAFYCRFQIAFMIAGALLWLIVVRRTARPIFLVVTAVFVVGCGLNELLDHWLYRAWVLTPYRYWFVNIVQGKAATFATGPWWFVPAYMAAVLIPPYSVAIIAILCIGCWYARRDVLVWMVTPFVIVHALVDRKDPRFLIPLVHIVGPLFAVCVDRLPSHMRVSLGAWGRRSWGRANVAALCAVNAVALSIVIVMPVHDTARVDYWLWASSRDHHVDVYTIGEPPYDAADFEMDSFYISKNISVKPFTPSTQMALRDAGAPVFIYYKGTTAPPSLGAVRCPIVLRTFPRWLAEFPLFERLTNVEPATVCQLEPSR